MKKIIFGLFILSLSFGAVDTKKAEQALAEYNNTKQMVNIVFQKADTAIQELTALVVELQGELVEKNTTNTDTEL